MTAILKVSKFPLRGNPLVADIVFAHLVCCRTLIVPIVVYASVKVWMVGHTVMSGGALCALHGGRSLSVAQCLALGQLAARSVGAANRFGEIRGR